MRTFKLVICLFLVFAFFFSLLALPSLASGVSYVWSDTVETSANITNENIIKTVSIILFVFLLRYILSPYLCFNFNIYLVNLQ